MRSPYSGSVPVAGRPAFLRLTGIDFAIITYNVKASRGEARTSAPALTRAKKDCVTQMTRADSVLSTPPTNTPTDTTRRRFLAVAAVGSFVGAGSLAAAAIAPPNVPQAVTIPPAPCLAVPAVLSDPAFVLIADKRAADIAHGKAIDAEEEAEEHGIGLDEAYDRCSAACHAAQAIYWKLATTLPTTLAGVAA